VPETVYERILEGGTTVDEEIVQTTPVPIEIDRIQEDPRKITLYCDCGQEAVYRFRAAKRVMPLCSSSGCLKKALPRLEEWVKSALSKSWELLSGEDILTQPKPPKLTAKEEILAFQREQGLSEDGIVGEETKEALRRVGREGMIPIWRDRLLEEA
jgi:hypothetical protein